ncbi:dihydrolipoamide acetyltransferase family protein [Kytococcus sedentarius]|uniref:dihydrolipoamide acetyltransferase family protein n=1 Tax=Kytococcus sedentarius TaxID=1276 RepID=UPI00194F63B8|nr:dihydrolipoamide acetyltransferase family protein [Kytococcus sedentarius]QRO87664.1 2-oxo acid dehydrogenase subunit E2 [Kytococcus sedentarius]
MSENQQVFMLPDLGEGLTEAEVVEWLVAEGDEVVIDQNVVTVETAKATVEVPIPFAGTVSELHGQVGDVMEVGRPLISVGGASGGAAGSGGSSGADGGASGTQGADADPGHSASDPRAGHEQYRREERAGAEVPQGDGETTDEGSGAVLIGFGTGHGGGSRRRRTPRGAARSAGAPATPQGASDSAPQRSPEATSPQAGASATAHGTGQPPIAPRVISPLVRRLAAERGIDLASLTPSQSDGVIRRADVEAASPSTPGAGESAQQGADSPETGASASAGTGTGTGAGASGTSGAEQPQLSDERIPLTGLMRMMSERLTTSRGEIPDATTWVDADATELLRTKDALKAARPDAGIGVLPLMARIVVAGLARFPALNAGIEMQDGTAVAIQRHARVNLGFAAQSPRGLVVPVVHDAQDLSTAELALALRELTALARDGRLTPAQLTGGTFTLNNYGVFGVDGSTPIINHPEAAMLGVGRIIDRPWAVDGKVKVRKVTQLGLTFDHRVCDGGTAGGLLRFVADCVENPAVLLSEL